MFSFYYALVYRRHCFQVIHLRVLPCTHASIRVHVRVCVLSAQYLRTQWREFHQTSDDDVVKAKDKLVRFWRLRSQSQGRYKVKCEKLWDSISWTAWSITIKYKYTTANEEKMTHLCHEGHYWLRQGQDQTKVTCENLLPIILEQVGGFWPNLTQILYTLVG